MTSESYHRKKQGGGKVITTVRTSEPLFLQVRIKKPKEKVRELTIFEWLPCRHGVRSDFIYITSFNIHKNPTQKKLLSLLTVIDSEGKWAHNGSVWRWRWSVVPPNLWYKSPSCPPPPPSALTFSLYKWPLNVFLKVKPFWLEELEHVNTAAVWLSPSPSSVGLLPRLAHPSVFHSMAHPSVFHQMPKWPFHTSKLHSKK